jgi:copper(I)-binding protein
MRRLTVLAICALAAAALVYVALSVWNQPQPVTLSNATAVPVPAEQGVLHVYMSLENGDQTNRLVSVSSPEAEAVIATGRGGPNVVLPAKSTPSLSSDGVYLKMTGVSGSLDEGRLVPIVLEFDVAGAATTRARIGAPADPHAAHRMAGGMAAQQSDAPPELTMTVSATETGEWTVDLRTVNFTFVPEKDVPLHVPGEGHGHLYLNGLKLGRVYDTKVTIGALPKGRHEVEVTLNTNTHMPYMNADGPVSARQVINVD